MCESISFLLYSLIYFIFYFIFIPHISNIIWYLSFFVFLISLSIVASKSIHVCCKWQNFIFFAVSFSIVCIYHIFFIHLSVDGHLGSLCSLVTVNSAVMNSEDMCIFRFCFYQVYTQDWDCWVIFGKTCMLYSIVAEPMYILTNSVQVFLFLWILSSIY